MSPARIRGDDLVRPIRGIRIPSESDGLEARLRAFALHRGVDFAFSHTTAAVLYGIPLPSGLQQDIHVSVPGSCRAPSVNGFSGHKLGRWNITELKGLPVTTPEQTWLDLATILGVRALVVAGDFLVSSSTPLTDLAALQRAITASTGRRGIGQARMAIESVREGSESPGETRLRLVLADAGLPEPSLNEQIFDASGTFVARVDLAYPAERVAIEYEGDYHRVDRDIWRKDIRRQRKVEDLGWRMVRVTADDLYEPDEFVGLVRRLLRAPRLRGAR